MLCGWVSNRQERKRETERERKIQNAKKSRNKMFFFCVVRRVVHKTRAKRDRRTNAAMVGLLLRRIDVELARERICACCAPLLVDGGSNAGLLYRVVSTLGCTPII